MNKTLAPIVLFVYNRPWHTLQTLEALAKNELADKSHLIIYADGPKESANDDDLKKINEVRAIIRETDWCKTVEIIESDINQGLANSIINGVTTVVNKFGKIIVLEDDIVPSRGFLKYMNVALNLYEDNENVGCIHAWNYHLPKNKIANTTFFLKGTDCWGWGTWKRTWKLFNPDSTFLYNEIKNKNLIADFNRKHTINYYKMLEDQMNQLIESWAIRWDASLLIAEKYCLYPFAPLVKNIGFDNTGVHCGNLNIIQKPIKTLKINKIDVADSSWFYDLYKKYYIDSLEQKSRISKFKFAVQLLIGK